MVSYLCFDFLGPSQGSFEWKGPLGIFAFSLVSSKWNTFSLGSWSGHFALKNLILSAGSPCSWQDTITSYGFLNFQSKPITIIVDNTDIVIIVVFENIYFMDLSFTLNPKFWPTAWSWFKLYASTVWRGVTLDFSFRHTAAKAKLLLKMFYFVVFFKFSRTKNHHIWLCFTPSVSNKAITSQNIPYKYLYSHIFDGIQCQSTT